MTVAGEEAPANSVPAAAVIRRGLTLFGFTGRKARVGGLLSWAWNPGAQPRNCVRNWQARVRERVVEFPV